MVPARVSQNVNPGCEQAQADHDGGENAASDAEPTKPPARRRGYQPETSDWGGCGRHALYMFLRNTVPSVEPVTDMRRETDGASDWQRPNALRQHQVVLDHEETPSHGCRIAG